MGLPLITRFQNTLKLTAVKRNAKLFAQAFQKIWRTGILWEINKDRFYHIPKDFLMSFDLHLGDCLEVMRSLPSNSVDLIFTSPPYNLGTSTTGSRFPEGNGQWGKPPLADGYASHDDAMPYAEYVSWQKEVLSECWRLLTDKGAIYYNHKPRVQSGVLQTPLDLNPNLPVRQIVIWKRSGGFNFNASFYLPTHEWVVIFAKPDFRLRDRKASGAKDVWEVAQEMKNEHPAPFPVALPMIALETTTAQVILDPFAGSGTVGVACARMGRKFIGIELDPGYHKSASERISAEYKRMASQEEPLIKI